MKKVAWLLAILALLAGGGAWLAVHYLDVIVEAAIEHYGPDLLGVKVDVREVRISARDGRGAIRGLDIGNPGGFSTPRAARFGEVRVAIDPATITADVVRIREIVIVSPSITYERGSKSANLDVIRRNIEASVKRSGAGGSSAGEARGKQRRYIVDRLAIRGTSVLMTNPGLEGQGLTFSLPDVELKDVGRREGGLPAGEVAAVVARAFETRIAQKVLSNVELLRRGGVEGAVDALKSLLPRGR